MKNYNRKVQEINDLVLTKKALDKDGMEHLKNGVKKYMADNGECDIDKIITMVINYTFTNGFHEGVLSCLKILRSK